MRAQFPALPAGKGGKLTRSVAGRAARLGLGDQKPVETLAHLRPPAPASSGETPPPLSCRACPPPPARADTDAAPACGRGPAISVSWMASVSSSPTRSDCSSGPSTDSRAPNPSLVTSSMVSASQMPSATSAIASRFKACCSRLPMKPGMSLRTCTGFRPAPAINAMVRATTSSAVASFWMTSTSRTRCGGFQKCAPTTRPRCLRWRPISVVGSAELLLARIVSGDTIASSSAKIFCFRSRFSSTASMTNSAPCTAGGKIVMGRDAVCAGRIVAQQIGDLSQPRRQRRAQFGGQLEHADIVAGGGKTIGNAVAHEAGADNRDLRFRHGKRPFAAAVSRPCSRRPRT